MAKPNTTQPDDTHTHSHASDPKRHPEIGDSKQIDFSIPWAQVDVAYQAILHKYQPLVKTDGFRKGHAPIKMVEQMVGLERLYQETAEKVLPQAYVEAVKKANAKPISDPEIHPTSMEMGKDWVFHAHIAERPTAELGKYEQIASKAAKQFDTDQKKLAKPDAKKEPTPETEKVDEQTLKDQKLNAILAALRESIKPIIPELLVRQEAQQQLDQLAQQMKMYNIELPSYLKSMGKDEADLQQEYVGRALASWQLEIILDGIALDQKIETKEKELDEMITKNYPDPTTVTPAKRSQVQAMMRKQKVFEYLLALK
ncbi:MAG: trigger factor [Patescibacteria group bacterium]